MWVRNSVLMEYGFPGRAVNPNHWAVFTQLFAYTVQILRTIRIWPSFWHQGTEFRIFRLGYGNPDGFSRSTHLRDVDPSFCMYTPNLTYNSNMTFILTCGTEFEHELLFGVLVQLMIPFVMKGCGIPEPGALDVIFFVIQGNWGGFVFMREMCRFGKLIYVVRFGAICI